MSRHSPSALDAQDRPEKALDPTRWSLISPRRDNRLGNDPQAGHRVANHQGDHRQLASQHSLPVGIRLQGDAMREVDRDDMAHDDGADRYVPDGASVDQPDPAEMGFRAEQVPTEAERIRAHSS